MENKIEIFKSSDNQIELQVQIDTDTVWLTQEQMEYLFQTTKQNISLHINNVFAEKELDKNSTVKESLTVRTEGKRQVKRKIQFYNLDVIISVGYRVKSQRGTQFRQWATQRLKDYLVQGYAINEKRLAQKQLEVEYLKTGIRILNRAMAEQTTAEDFELLRVFAKGLSLLDDYDNELLDKKGITQQQTIYPTVEEYLKMIQIMYSGIESDVFAKPKDESFHSSVNQIKQSFGDVELYPTIEEKAANLLYFITKNHSFVDGNKRIAAACFLYFMEQNKALLKPDGTPIIDNATLAALTLFIATSKPEEADIVKQLTISILNRNKL
ncbi:MAG TPA: virulence protein RhuM/Fic/DOC family protein [Prolixibacteraceae bacterium]|jgi:prophage maintenance system killer protein|nr:virulence protein RhuM/Fic/DOC family protein [Bacteroidales bacterium]HOC87113.1 virulence protein RhuM/Fic/DOC family protein [Prolixibacteraceae bacterium]HOF55414.1 virulence protein RhuM/Fic/DOC family protein [Prolixibacteraceae bacterium]HOG96307.1 virulence protein RhuM/Fic/DOC family protein [Prolixibacteraceae bacterium]HOS00118.1 virulence protein RhuM/Fic/DOC family protein [Prolixibacteraceae bacterium]